MQIKGDSFDSRAREIAKLLRALALLPMCHIVRGPKEEREMHAVWRNGLSACYRLVPHGVYIYCVASFLYARGCTVCGLHEDLDFECIVIGFACIIELNDTTFCSAYRLMIGMTIQSYIWIYARIIHGFHCQQRSIQTVYFSKEYNREYIPYRGHNNALKVK